MFYDVKLYVLSYNDIFDLGYIYYTVLKNDYMKQYEEIFVDSNKFLPVCVCFANI